MKVSLGKFKSKSIVVVFCLFCFSWGATSKAKPRSANCTQEYKFILKTEADNVFWVEEDIFGECSASNLIQIFTKNQPVIATKTEISFQQWDWTTHIKGAIRCEQAIEMNAQNGALLLETMNLKLRNPKFNNELRQRFISEFSNDCAKQWNSAMGRQGVELPRTDNNLVLDLVYINPEGLYLDYKLVSGYAFPHSNLILIITTNDHKCARNNGTNGFMICRYRFL